jgi:hypothetical protein
MHIAMIDAFHLGGLPAVAEKIQRPSSLVRRASLGSIIA